MDAEWKFIDIGAFTAEVKDTDFGVGYTTIEAGLGVRLLRDPRQYVHRWLKTE